MSYTDFIVPHWMAKLLKDTGFDTPCFFYYNDLESVLYDGTNVDYNKDENLYSAPTYDQVYKWFADREFYLEFDFSSTSKFGGFVTYKEVQVMLEEPTYEALREAGILELMMLYRDRDNIKELKVENDNLEW